jgi:hypothetical protein
MKECPIVRCAILAAALLLAARASAQSLVVTTITDGFFASAAIEPTFGPAGIAVDPSGNLYVADPVNCVLNKYSPTGVLVMTVGKAGDRGWSDGPLGLGYFNTPTGVALDAAGNIYVADQMNSTIRKITPSGTMSTLAGAPNVYGHQDGTGGSALFCQPTALTIDASGNLFVADGANGNLNLPNSPGICIRKVTPSGVVTTVSNMDGIVAAGLGVFNLMGIAVDGQGNLFVSVGPMNDSVAIVVEVYPPPNGNAIFKVSPAGVASLYAGQPQANGSADGPAAQALFNNPGALAFDGAGSLYVSDNYNETIRVISPAGVVTTIAGAAGSSGLVDGAGGQARLTAPEGLAVDAYGNVFFNDLRATRRGIPAANTQGPVRFVNLSARATVSPSGPLIVGFVIEGTAAQTVLARGVGTGLTAFAVSNPLSSAQLDIYDNTGSLVASTAAGMNATNSASAEAITGAFPVGVDPGDASLVITLKPGPYTAVVSSPSGTTGAALVEVYEVP